MSIALAPYSVLTRREAVLRRLGEQVAVPEPLDDEEGDDGAAERHRQVGRRRPSTMGKSEIDLVPGRLHELGAVEEHEEVRAAIMPISISQPTAMRAGPCSIIGMTATPICRFSR